MGHAGWQCPGSTISLVLSHDHPCQVHCGHLKSPDYSLLNAGPGGASCGGISIPAGGVPESGTTETPSDTQEGLLAGHSGLQN
jgi:hypothetical protein